MSALGGVWRGTVDRVGADGRPWVTVPRRGGRWSFGPCPVLEGLWTAGGLTGAAGGHAHAHVAPAGLLAAGDDVLVAFIEGVPDLVVVLGRLAP